MTAEQQNKSWACLPKETRDYAKQIYQDGFVLKEYTEGVVDILKLLFGHRNLTSDTEPEEVLTAKKSKVVEFIENIDEHIRLNPNDKIPFTGIKVHLKELFGDKCLPDKPIEEKAKEIVGVIKDSVENPIQMPETMLMPDKETMNRCEKCGANAQQCADSPCQNYPMEEKSLKEKYWKTGNIFEFNNGKKRVVWNDNVIDKGGYIPKELFNDNLVNVDSTVGECVIRIYSQNTKAGYFDELIKPKCDRLLWEKSEFIFTEKEIKKKLGIPEEKELIIIK